MGATQEAGKHNRKMRLLGLFNRTPNGKNPNITFKRESAVFEFPYKCFMISNCQCTTKN